MDYNFEEYKERLEKYYIDYTTNVSTDGMAISLQTACFMYYLCEKFRFRKIMDRGSGFSSFVLRKYALEEKYMSHSNIPVEVYSIDDNKEWLNKTKNFLKKNKLDTKKMYMWDWFYNKYKNKLKFDFMLEDAKKQLRVETPDKFTSFISDDGVIIFDDAKVHHGLITNQCEKLSMNKYNIKHLTLDSYDRYAMLTTKRELKDFERI